MSAATSGNCLSLMIRYIISATQKQRLIRGHLKICVGKANNEIDVSFLCKHVVQANDVLVLQLLQEADLLDRARVHACVYVRCYHMLL